MIKDCLIPALIKKYGEHAFKVGSPPEPIATFPAVHQEVGDLIICDDDCEATIYVGNIIHVHFDPCSDISQNEIDVTVTEDVLKFLEELFTDKILLYKSCDDGVSGWQGGFAGKVSSIKSNVSYFVWSGPCNPEEDAEGLDMHSKDKIFNVLSSMTLAEAQELVWQIEQAFGSDYKENKIVTIQIPPASNPIMEQQE
jgi:hypothetical protein